MVEVASPLTYMSHRPLEAEHIHADAKSDLIFVTRLLKTTLVLTKHCVAEE